MSFEFIEWFYLLLDERGRATNNNDSHTFVGIPGDYYVKRMKRWKGNKDDQWVVLLLSLFVCVYECVCVYKKSRHLDLLLKSVSIKWIPVYFRFVFKPEEIEFNTDFFSLHILKLLVTTVNMDRTSTTTRRFSIFFFVDFSMWVVCVNGTYTATIQRQETNKLKRIPIEWMAFLPLFVCIIFFSRQTNKKTFALGQQHFDELSSSI